MKKFIGYFKDFHKNYFSFSLYWMVSIFIAALIYFNYSFDFEDSVIDHYYGKPIRTLMYFGYHAFAFYGVLLIIYFYDSTKIHFTKTFWMKSILGLLILAVDRSVFPFISHWILPHVPAPTYRFYFKLLFNTYGLFTMVGTMAIMVWVFDRKERNGIYGLQFRKVQFRPYFILLLLMVPLILFATFLPGFLEYYPTYKRAGGLAFAHYYQLSEWVAKVVFEFFYLIDFVNTELFFRGFLVIGLSKLLGKNVVLPMAATYAVLHFGKPMGETISSVFGGYLLGIIALYSRNIWGGVFIHGGIAFLMELFAFWRN
jgi:hypothetical protein